MQGHSLATRGAAEAPPTRPGGARARRLALAFVGALATSFAVASTPAAAQDSETCQNADVRAQQRSEFLPDCRAFELVSPVRKFNGGVVVGQRASDDGEAVGFIMNAATGAEGSAYLANPFVARRTADGWESATAAPPVRAEHRGPSEVNANVPDYSNDFSKVVLITNDPIDPDDVEPMASGTMGYNYDLYSFSPWTREASWLSRPLPALAADYNVRTTGSYYGERSDDASHITFAVGGRLIDDAPMGATFTLYEWVDGQVRLVGIMPDETPAVTATSMGLLGGSGFAPPVNVGMRAMSADGSRIYWKDTPAFNSSGVLYLREDGERTLPVSISQRTGTEGTMANATLLSTTRDGSQAYFITAALLTDAAPTGGGLYRWDRATQTVTHLSPFRQQREYALSDDGERLYMISSAAVTPEGQAGARNLYMWDGSALKLIAILSSSTPTYDPRVRITRDGRYALFTTRTSLDPRQPTGTNAIYLYDAETGDYECVSCRPDGRPSTAEAYLRTRVVRYANGLGGDIVAARNLTPDGRVFFQTAEPLVAHDGNGELDVYEYDSGEVELISDGKGTGSELIDSSDDGSSVFFYTANKLTASDIDGGYPDVYVARVGGGFQEPEPGPERCAGDSCQGLGSIGPSGVPLGSSTFFGAGDAASERKPLIVAGARTVRGARAVLRVRVPVAGQLTVRGAGVRGVARNAAGAATVRVPVRLTKAAKRRLARRGQMKARVRLVFTRSTGGSVSRSVSVTFKRPAKSGAGRGR